MRPNASQTVFSNLSKVNPFSDYNGRQSQEGNIGMADTYGENLVAGMIKHGSIVKTKAIINRQPNFCLGKTSDSFKHINKNSDDKLYRV